MDKQRNALEKRATLRRLIAQSRARLSFQKKKYDTEGAAQSASSLRDLRLALSEHEQKFNLVTTLEDSDSDDDDGSSGTEESDEDIGDDNSDTDEDEQDDIAEGEETINVNYDNKRNRADLVAAIDKSRQSPITEKMTAMLRASFAKQDGIAKRSMLGKRSRASAQSDARAQQYAQELKEARGTIVNVGNKSVRNFQRTRDVLEQKRIGDISSNNIDPVRYPLPSEFVRHEDDIKAAKLMQQFEMDDYKLAPPPPGITYSQNKIVASQWQILQNREDELDKRAGLSTGAIEANRMAGQQARDMTMFVLKKAGGLQFNDAQYRGQMRKQLLHKDSWWVEPFYYTRETRERRRALALRIADIREDDDISEEEKVSMIKAMEKQASTRRKLFGSGGLRRGGQPLSSQTSQADEEVSAEDLAVWANAQPTEKKLQLVYRARKVKKVAEREIEAEIKNINTLSAEQITALKDVERQINAEEEGLSGRQIKALKKVAKEFTAEIENLEAQRAALEKLAADNAASYAQSRQDAADDEAEGQEEDQGFIRIEKGSKGENKRRGRKGGAAKTRVVSKYTYGSEQTKTFAEPLEPDAPLVDEETFPTGETTDGTRLYIHTRGQMTADILAQYSNGADTAHAYIIMYSVDMEQTRTNQVFIKVIMADWISFIDDVETAQAAADLEYNAEQTNVSLPGSRASSLTGTPPLIAPLSFSEARRLSLKKSQEPEPPEDPPEDDGGQPAQVPPANRKIRTYQEGMEALRARNKKRALALEQIHDEADTALEQYLLPKADPNDTDGDQGGLEVEYGPDGNQGQEIKYGPVGDKEGVDRLGFVYGAVADNGVLPEIDVQRYLPDGWQAQVRAERGEVNSRMKIMLHANGLILLPVLQKHRARLRGKTRAQLLEDRGKSNEDEYSYFLSLYLQEARLDAQEHQKVLRLASFVDAEITQADMTGDEAQFGGKVQGFVVLTMNQADLTFSMAGYSEWETAPVGGTVSITFAYLLSGSCDLQLIFMAAFWRALSAKSKGTVDGYRYQQYLFFDASRKVLPASNAIQVLVEGLAEAYSDEGLLNHGVVEVLTRVFTAKTLPFNQNPAGATFPGQGIPYAI